MRQIESITTRMPADDVAAEVDLAGPGCTLSACAKGEAVLRAVVERCRGSLAGVLAEW
jgi:hypothetical protein